MLNLREQPCEFPIYQPRIAGISQHTGWAYYYADGSEERVENVRVRPRTREERSKRSALAELRALTKGVQSGVLEIEDIEFEITSNRWDFDEIYAGIKLVPSEQVDGIKITLTGKRHNNLIGV